MPAVQPVPSPLPAAGKQCLTQPPACSSSPDTCLTCAQGQAQAQAQAQAQREGQTAQLTLQAGQLSLQSGQQPPSPRLQQQGMPLQQAQLPGRPGALQVQSALARCQLHLHPAPWLPSAARQFWGCRHSLLQVSLAAAEANSESHSAHCVASCALNCPSSTAPVTAVKRSPHCCAHRACPRACHCSVPSCQAAAGGCRTAVRPQDGAATTAVDLEVAHHGAHLHGTLCLAERLIALLQR